MNRLFLLHQGLFDRHTHYYGEALGWREACLERGITLHLYVHRNADPTLVAELSAIPAFSYQTDAMIEQDSVCRHLSDFITVSESIAQGCEALQREGIGGDDMVVVSFSSARDIYGAALWLQGLPAEERPSFAFIFHAPDLFWAVDSGRSVVSGDFAAARYAMKRLRAVLPPQKTAVYAAAEYLAQALQEILDYPCLPCPMPTYYGDVAALQAPAATDPGWANVRLVGEFRGEKGAELVVPTLLRIAELRPGTSFALQVISQEMAHAVAADLAPIQIHASPVLVEFGQFSQAAYQRRLLRSNVLLLPYVWSRYALRSSGVFSEAAGFGQVTVVPDRTWMADCLRNGWGAGAVFGELNPNTIAEAAIMALDNYPALKERALSRSDEWRRQNCAAAVDLIMRRPKSGVDRAS